jgi:hypothetical protein
LEVCAAADSDNRNPKHGEPEAHPALANPEPSRLIQRQHDQERPGKENRGDEDADADHLGQPRQHRSHVRFK